MDDHKQELFYEMTEHLLKDEVPSIYLNELLKKPRSKEFPLNLLLKMQKTEQSKKHHPEGNVWNHTMLVTDEAAKVREKSKDSRVFMWAALLHDIGKPDTTRMRKGRITAYDHDKVGTKLCVEFLRFFTDEEEFIDSVRVLVRYHMHMLYVLNKLPFGDIENLLKEADINEIALLSLCDRLGRTGADIDEEQENYEKYLSKLQTEKEKVK
ncbi:MAG TPA: phosphohydrolase [Clostridiales bacterium]|mgnify:CR=1 FL=1|nr:phosphohydrolase [Clostridiales bacterium]